MPKKLENDVKEVKTKKTTTKTGKASKTETKKSVAKKTTTKKATAEKTEPKVTTKKAEAVAKKATKTTSTKKATATQKAETKTVEKVTKKTTTKTARTTRAKAVVKVVKDKLAKTKVKATEVKKPEFLQEYYDLPYRYNETIVTILVQTPKRLFVYWDISDKDREAYRKAFGDDFFEKTYPVLLVHNEEMNYTFEVPINDFANSWYLDIQDSKKNYVVQLGRKFKNLEQARPINNDVVKEEHINLQNDFIYITDSNKLEAPNDHILFELLTNQVKYRNVKTGEEYTKDLRDMVSELANVYPAEVIHELYTKLYAEELSAEDFGRRNPASGEFGEFGLPTSSGAPRSSGTW